MGRARRPAGALAAVAALWCGCGGEPPPNLLLVTVDTLRADRLTCYGGSAGAGLCGLFDDGTRYRWAFSSAPNTAASVASLLTSRYPAFHGVTRSVRSFLADDVVTVAELLSAAGYTTAAFVSNPVLDRSRRLDQGFATWDQRMTRREPNRPGFGEREAAATSDAAMAWAQRSGREPWFVWVHYQDPHGPYLPPGAEPAHDDPRAPPLPVLRGHSGRGGIPAYQALPGLFTLRGYQDAYLDEIRYLDRHLVRLVRGLDAIAHAPAVLLTSDHGEAFGEDGYYFAHGHSVALDQIRVPLLYRAPRPGAARVIDEAVSGVDVAPTLLALAGLPIPGDFQGRALPGVTARAADPPRDPRPVFAEHALRAAVISGGRFYARERERSEEPEHFATRVAVLGGADALPADAAADGRDDTAPLESLLGAYLAAAPERGGAHQPAVARGLRERLRALGYGSD